MSAAESSAFGPGLTARKLSLDDYNKGYCQLLSQLTTVEPLSFQQFEGRFTELAKLGDDNVNIVVEDDATGKLIAAGTLFVVGKYIHSCAKAGYIEEIVVDKQQRGRHIGQKVIQHLVKLAQNFSCYKIILSCNDSNVGFYEQCQFERKGACMARYV